MKKHVPTAIVAALVALLTCSLPNLSRAQQAPDRSGPAERIGQRVDKALREIQRDFQDLSEDVQHRFASARAEVDSMSVAARVYGRLHWDKALVDAKIAVDVQDDKTTVLTGNVPTAAAKVRAEEITRGTVGVDKVENRLDITPAQDDASAP